MSIWSIARVAGLLMPGMLICLMVCVDAGRSSKKCKCVELDEHCQ